MTAVFVNCAAVILGSLLGLLFSGRIGSRMEEVIRTGAGIVTLVLGLQMAFEFQNVVYFTLAVIAGGITGTALDIDAKILCLGKLLERLVYRNKVSAATAAGEEVQPLRNFAHAFLNSSVLFCVGAMAILGFLQKVFLTDLWPFLLRLLWVQVQYSARFRFWSTRERLPF